MSRIAGLVGVDAYPHSPLKGCVADVAAIRALLERNDDGSVHFHCRSMLNEEVTRARLRQVVHGVFAQRDLDLAVFFSLVMEADGVRTMMQRACSSRLTRLLATKVFLWNGSSLKPTIPPPRNAS